MVLKGKPYGRLRLASITTPHYAQQVVPRGGSVTSLDVVFAMLTLLGAAGSWLYAVHLLRKLPRE